MKTLAAAVALVAALHAASLEAADEPSVLVKTQPLREQRLDVTLAGYGVVEPPSGRTTRVNLPRAGRIVALRVSAGQVVKRGEPLFEVQTDPVAGLDYGRAVHAFDFAQGELGRIEELARERLATRSQVAAAKQALADARARLHAQQRLGMDGRRVFAAPYDGVVQSLSAAPGDRLGAGAAVLQLAHTDVLQVRLGIEPEDAARVHPGAAVRIASVFDPGRALDAKVSSVQGMIDPRTELVDVIVALRPAARDPLLPGMRVRGDITVASTTGWVVPRRAVLADGKGDYLFQVKDGHARRVTVATGAQSGGLVAVSGDLDPGLPVVVLGNYELSDGMAVREGGT